MDIAKESLRVFTNIISNITQGEEKIVKLNKTGLIIKILEGICLLNDDSHTEFYYILSDSTKGIFFEKVSIENDNNLLLRLKQRKKNMDLCYRFGSPLELSVAHFKEHPNLNFFRITFSKASKMLPNKYQNMNNKEELIIIDDDIIPINEYTKNINTDMKLHIVNHTKQFNMLVFPVGSSYDTILAKELATDIAKNGINQDLFEDILISFKKYHSLK